MEGISQSIPILLLSILSSQYSLLGPQSSLEVLNLLGSLFDHSFRARPCQVELLSQKKLARWTGKAKPTEGRPGKKAKKA